MTLSGYRLSLMDLPSRKNSGENIMFLFLCFLINFSVNPIGIVDFMIMIIFGLLSSIFLQLIQLVMCQIYSFLH